MENKNITNKINQKWLKWFVGFNDEGNFQVYPKKRVLKSGEISKYNVGYAYHLSLHKRDILRRALLLLDCFAVEIIKNIKYKLNNVGTIYEYVNKPDSRLAVNDKAGLLSLIHNVFDVFSFSMENKNITNKINQKWLKWFVGFNDEGNFQVYPKKRVLKSGEISKYNVGYAYHLSLHKRDILRRALLLLDCFAVEIIKNIKYKLNNVGTIYEYVNKPDSRLAVNDKAGLLSLIHNVFDVFPLVWKIKI